MQTKIVGALTLTLLLAVGAAAQSQSDLLDIYIAHVKSDKRMEFDGLVKKMVAAQKKGGGDNWLTYEPTYGEGNTIYFVSMRQNYAAVDSAMEGFMQAMNKTIGMAGMAKLFQDMGATQNSFRTELRRRRWDMSANIPSDTNKQIAESRFLRITVVRVRPGRNADFEAAARVVKEGYEKNNKNFSLFASQATDGQVGAVYYFTVPLKTIGALDALKPLGAVLSESENQRFGKAVADTTLNTETMIVRFIPELSNPPAEVKKGDPAFWDPKPPAPPKPKAAAPAAEKKK